MDVLLADFVQDFDEVVIEEAHTMARYSRRQSMHKEDPFEWQDKVFIKNFRLSKVLTEQLIQIIQPVLQPTTTFDIKTKTLVRCSVSVPVNALPAFLSGTQLSSLAEEICRMVVLMQKGPVNVLCALQFFAQGSYQTPVGGLTTINMSQASVSRCISEVVVALNNPNIFNEWVHFPNSFGEMNKIVREFYDMYGFPGVIGCIDCTHVAIVPPASTAFDERSYVNRKGFHSINTQLICDARLKIININALFPGSTHDCHVWNNSNVFHLLEQMHRLGHMNYHLIGDSGYPLRPWCLTPLRQPEANSPEYAYSEALKKARSTVERCNGVLKGRFRCLIKDRVLHYAPNKATKIINACAVLHNMCINSNMEEPYYGDLSNEQLGVLPEIDSIENSPTPSLRSRINIQLIQGRAKQNRIINNYFNR